MSPQGREREGNQADPSVVGAIRGKLLVSCQALRDEPLHGSMVMAKQALAAWQGGAGGIRANSGVDIAAIRAQVPLPIIGIVKREYADSPVYITPTLAEAEEAVQAGAHILALDATNRPRPRGVTLGKLVAELRQWGIPLMADVSSVEEGIRAAEMGFDLVATTLVGHESEQAAPFNGPEFQTIETMVREVAQTRGVPVIAEGHIWEPAQALRCIDMGAHAVVVGSAITRPQLITRRFAEVLSTHSPRQERHSELINSKLERGRQS